MVGKYELLSKGGNFGDMDPFCFVAQKQDIVEVFLQYFLQICAEQKFTAINAAMQSYQQAV